MGEFEEMARELKVWAKFVEFLDGLSEEEREILWRLLKKHAIALLVVDAMGRKFEEVMKEMGEKYQSV